MSGVGHGGLVVLVGAGPGDAGLITAAGASWISKSDVIIYDRLVNPELLRLAPKRTELINVGKAPNRPGPTQQQINDLLIEQCRLNRLVVRLKGGDPLIFGRGGEEIDALRAAGCEFRIVPGVTAAVAAAAYAGIALTDRRRGSTVALVTGHDATAKDTPPIAWDALAKIDTLVFYMPVGNLPAIVERLISAGRAAKSSAAVIENATTPSQRTIMATLETITRKASAGGVRPPGLLVVGEVVKMREGGTWREKLPLFGRTVLVTRPREQGSSLIFALTELGARAIEGPTVQIEPPEEFGPLDCALRRVGEFDWVVLTSPNGAEHMLRRIEALGFDARKLGGTKIAAIGPATAEALHRRFLTPDLIPEHFTTEALGRELIAREQLPGKALLLVRGDIASRELPQMLLTARATVEEVTAYRAVRPAALPPAVIDALSARAVDWITFTSSSTVENFLAMIDRDKIDLSGVNLAAIGPVTGETLRTAGLVPTVIAAPHTVAALAEAIATFGR